MLYQHIGINLNIAAQLATVAHEVVGITGDQALVGDHNAVKDIDPDKLRPGTARDREGTEGIIAQHIQPQRDSNQRLQMLHNQAHGADNRRIHLSRLERHIVKIFDDNAVYTPRRQSGGLLLSPGNYGLKAAAPAR